MAELSFPLLTLGIVAPLAGALGLGWVAHDARVRRLAVSCALVTLALSIEALRQVSVAGSVRLFEPWSLALLGPARPWFSADALNAALMTLFAALVAGALLAAPRRDLGRRMAKGLLIMLAATQAAYAAENLLILFIAWTATVVPFAAGAFSGGETGPSRAGPRILLLAAAGALAASLAIIAATAAGAGAADPLSLMDLREAPSPAGPWAFGLLMLAVSIRKGVFPFHPWVIAAFDRGPLLPAALLVSNHLGVYLVARLAIPLMPEIARDTLPLLGNLALLTALYAAVVALAEREPRRLLAFLAVSQSSFLLAGIQSPHLEAVTGALVHWLVVGAALMGLAVVYRASEARLGGSMPADRFLGLAARAPRLAVAFAVCGLALVGLPGTLGFCAEDLLFHGALESYPWLGVILPVATALNAVHLFRLFSRLFLGSMPGEFAEVPDALPRERWVLTGCILFLVWFGLMPGKLVTSRAQAAESILRALEPAAAEVAPGQHPTRTAD